MMYKCLKYAFKTKTGIVVNLLPHVGVSWSQVPEGWQILKLDPMRPYPLSHAKEALVPT